MAAQIIENLGRIKAIEQLHNRCGESVGEKSPLHLWERQPCPGVNECNRLITTIDNNFRGAVIQFANSHDPDSEGYMRRSSACLMVGRTRGKRTLLKLFYFLSMAG